LFPEVNEKSSRMVINFSKKYKPIFHWSAEKNPNPAKEGVFLKWIPPLLHEKSNQWFIFI